MLAKAALLVAALALLSVGATPFQIGRYKCGSGSPEQDFDTIVSSHDIVVFTKPDVPDCEKVKELFDYLHLPYFEYSFGKDDYNSQISSHAFRVTKRRSVPLVFIKGVFFGGYEDIEALFVSGRFQPGDFQCKYQQRVSERLPIN